MKLRADQVDLIAAAMLAANNFPLWRAQEIVPKLRKARLLDPDYVVDLDPGPLTVQLASAGYDRGMLTTMFAERIRSLARAVRDGTLDPLGEAVADRDEAAALKLLMAIKGVGPVVARSAYALLTT